MAPMLVSTVGASLYVLALCVAMTLIVPVPRNASRFARVAHAACGVGGAAAIAAALASTVAGLWALAGGLAVLAAAAIVPWLRLTLRSRETEPDDGDDSDDDGGGGRLRRPPPPAPSTPLGGPPTDWTQFDRARETWERSRVPAGF
jgi:hypothetical protein